MFRLQRFTQQGIVHEVNLTDGQILCCPRPRVDLHELGGSQRITITSAPFSFRDAHRLLLSSGSSHLIVHILMLLACYASCSARYLGGVVHPWMPLPFGGRQLKDEAPGSSLRWGTGDVTHLRLGHFTAVAE